MNNYSQPTLYHSSPNKNIRSWHWMAIAILLLIFAALAVTASKRTAPTADEVAHLPKGYTRLVSGELRLGRETPILAPAIAALPLLKYHLTMPLKSKSYRDLNQYLYGQDFLYHNKLSADRIIELGRYPIIFLGIILGIVVFFLGRRFYGSTAGVAALAFYILEPNILAQANLTTVEIAFSLTFLLALAAFMAYLDKPAQSRLIITGIAFGLALATKHSSVLLFAIFLIILTMRYFKKEKRERRAFKDIIVPIFSMSIIAYIVIIAVYMGDCKPLIAADDPVGENLSSLQARLPQDDSLVSRVVYWGLKDLRLPAADWLRGFAFQFLHAGKGHEAYLLGKYSVSGWWYYFPVALAVKLNIGFLLLACAGAVLWRKMVVPPLTKMVLPAAMLVVLLAHMAGNINIGIRYLMPLFPIMAIFAGSIFSYRFKGRTALFLVVFLWMAYGAYSVYPHFLTYFNEIAGGPRGGIRILADSNLDWGQGLYDLRDWQKRNLVKELRYSYFGAALPRYHGIKGLEMRASEKYHPGTGIYAISANNLLAIFEKDKEAYAVFRIRKPDAIIANSIYVYEIR